MQSHCLISCFDWKSKKCKRKILKANKRVKRESKEKQKIKEQEIAKYKIQNTKLEIEIAIECQIAM